jgi:Bacterial Ig domain/Putative flagellar system-associated repeat/Secretion system C-terminal sorting domain
MKILSTIICFALNITMLFSQVTLTIEGTIVNNSETGTWAGVNIVRSVPTALTYRNNSITAVNVSSYMLQAGDDELLITHNNLDGEIITGNKLIWNGTDRASTITHGIFTGYNINAVIKYNYLNKVPMAIIRKSNGMTNTEGGVAYNIVNKTGATAIAVKGMNGVNIYNNTIYSDEIKYTTEDAPGAWRGLADIYTNTDITPNAPSTGTKIKNNIFYTKYQISNISLCDAACITGFESDYNIFYCESGTPMFNYLGAAKTFIQWQALGYDTHSKVINPNFINFTDFVPDSRLDYGTDLGTTWPQGLSTTAVWDVGSSPVTTDQNGTWQVGARIYEANTGTVSYIGSVVENAAPAIIEMTYSLNLANIVPASSAFNVQVNSVFWPVNSVAISGSKVQLTLASTIKSGDIIKISYTKPATNPLQTAEGNQAVSISGQSVRNNCTNIGPNVIITSPGNGSSFNALASISITANASDSDGTISKVVFYNNTVKLGEITTTPYIYTWTNVNSGTYVLTAIATDNTNATATSSSVVVNVHTLNDVDTKLINLFPNPNRGDFTLELLNPLLVDGNKISIVNSAGKVVYDGILFKKEITKQFDLSYLNSGIYILMIIGKEIIITKEFIKN